MWNGTNLNASAASASAMKRSDRQTLVRSKIFVRSPDRPERANDRSEIYTKGLIERGTRNRASHASQRCSIVRAIRLLDRPTE